MLASRYCQKLQMRFCPLTTSVLFLLMLAGTAFSQQTNPVERQVTNPITDTPNINPISAEQDISAPKLRKKPSFAEEGGDGEVVVYSARQTVEGDKSHRIVHHSGNVDVHYGIYRLQANDVTIYEAENKMDAEGSVVCDQGDDQRNTNAKDVCN